MNAPPMARKCNVCKRTLPWTHEHFDYKHGRIEYGLKVVCRSCSEKHFTGPSSRAAQRRNGPTRTTPNRLVYGLQPNHMDWPEWS